jgi:hypothetical protein
MPALYYEHVNAIADIVRRALTPLAPHASHEKLDATARALWAGVHGITSVAATEKGIYLTPSTAPAYAKELTATFVKGLRQL